MEKETELALLDLLGYILSDIDSRDHRWKLIKIKNMAEHITETHLK